MKLKYIKTTVVLGIFVFATSCNKSDHPEDHGKEKAVEHAEHDNSKETADEYVDGEDHSFCGVHTGANGGRVLNKIDGEILLSDDGKLTVFAKEGVTFDKLTVLVDSEPVTLIKSENNTYIADSVIEKLPASLHIAAVIDGEKSIDSFTLDLAVCDECTKKEYLCICDNHDH